MREFERAGLRSRFDCLDRESGQAALFAHRTIDLHPLLHKRQEFSVLILVVGRHGRVHLAGGIHDRQRGVLSFRVTCDLDPMHGEADTPDLKAQLDRIADRRGDPTSPRQVLLITC